MGQNHMQSAPEKPVAKGVNLWTSNTRMDNWKVRNRVGYHFAFPAAVVRTRTKHIIASRALRLPNRIVPFQPREPGEVRIGGVKNESAFNCQRCQVCIRGQITCRSNALYRKRLINP